MNSDRYYRRMLEKQLATYNLLLFINQVLLGSQI